MNYKRFSETPNVHLSFWQSSYWQQILLDSGQATEVFYFGNDQSTFFGVEIRSVGMGFLGAFVLGISQSQVADDIENCIDALKKYLATKRVLFVQIEPIEPIDGLPSVQKPAKEFLTPFTRYIDLSLSEDELLAQMHQKGRYGIRLAEKRGVEVRALESNQENIQQFYALLNETTQRDGFSGNTREYYENFLEKLGDSGQLFGAFFEGKMIAGGIFVLYNERAIYYYGASSSDSTARKQQSSHLIQWKAICEAKKRGMKIYDFLGIADPDNPNDPLAGVSRFKSQFGGYIETLPQKYLYPISKGKYALYQFVREVGKKIKRK